MEEDNVSWPIIFPLPIDEEPDTWQAYRMEAVTNRRARRPNIGRIISLPIFTGGAVDGAKDDAGELLHLPKKK